MREIMTADLLRLRDIGHPYIPLRNLSFALGRVLGDYHSPHRMKRAAWEYHLYLARAQV